MLVDERVAARIDDHLDVVAERLHTAQAVVDVIHLPAAHDGIGPEEARNRRLDGIGADGQIDCGHGRVAFLLAGMGTVDFFGPMIFVSMPFILTSRDKCEREFTNL